MPEQDQPQTAKHDDDLSLNKTGKGLSVSITIRFTRPEKDELIEKSELTGLSLSEYIRRRCLGRKVAAHVDEAMIRELRRQGGLLKMLSLKEKINMREAGITLDAIKQAIERLAK
jgi:hypothetical protein